MPLELPVPAMRANACDSSISMPEVRTLESRNSRASASLSEGQVGEVNDKVGCAVENSIAGSAGLVQCFCHFANSSYAELSIVL